MPLPQAVQAPGTAKGETPLEEAGRVGEPPGLKCLSCEHVCLEEESQPFGPGTKFLLKAIVITCITDVRVGAQPASWHPTTILDPCCEKEDTVPAGTSQA